MYDRLFAALHPAAVAASVSASFNAIAQAAVPVEARTPELAAAAARISAIKAELGQ